MNITLDGLELIALWLRQKAKGFADESPESDTFMDAADALDDARDLLEELA